MSVRRVAVVTNTCEEGGLGMGRIIRVLSLFSGIGAFEKALDRLGVEYDLVNYCEIDRYASKAYSLIHGVPESLNLCDITKVDADSLPKDIDLITYGFPCQDISNAGKMKGLFNEDGTQTRSGLFFEALRIIEDTKPKYAIAENVKNLTSKKFNAQFQVVLDSLESAGYNNYWKVLNAKDYGIPQNRERVFIVSIRKDVDNGEFAFPESIPLQLRLKDMLEDEVDEKYYLSDDAVNVMVEHMLRNEAKGNGFGAKFMDGNEVCSTLVTGSYKSNSPDLKVKQIGNIRPSSTRENPNQGRVYDSSGFSPTLCCMEGVNRQPFIVDDLYNSRDKRIYHYECPTLRSAKHGLKVYEPFIVASRGRNPTNPSDRTPGAYVEQTLEPNSQGVSNTLTTVQKDNLVCEAYFRIRKLTPKECFRLMGFDDRDVDILSENGISNTQLYKMAGNSIVVDVLEALFRSLFGLEGKRVQPLLEGWGLNIRIAGRGE